MCFHLLQFLATVFTFLSYTLAYFIPVFKDASVLHDILFNFKILPQATLWLVTNPDCCLVMHSVAGVSYQTAKCLIRSANKFALYTAEPFVLVPQAPQFRGDNPDVTETYQHMNTSQTQLI